MFQWCTRALDGQKVVSRVEDGILTPVTARTPASATALEPVTTSWLAVAAAADLHRVDIAAVPVAKGHLHRVIIGLVVHQHLRADPPRRLVAGPRAALQAARTWRPDAVRGAHRSSRSAQHDVRLALAALRLQAMQVLAGTVHAASLGIKRGAWFLDGSVVEPPPPGRRPVGWPGRGHVRPDKAGRHPRGPPPRAAWRFTVAAHTGDETRCTDRPRSRDAGPAGPSPARVLLTEQHSAYWI